MIGDGPWHQLGQNALTIVIVLSTTLNALVIGAFAKSYKKMTKGDIIIVSLATSDLLQSLFGYPSEVKSMFSKSDIGLAKGTCRFIGFVVSFMAYVSIAHLTYLCLERGLALRKPYMLNTMMESVYFIPCLLGGLWMYGFLWSVMPLLGWSAYEVEQDGYRCSIDWKNKSPTSHWYIGSLFVFCFIIPVSIIVVSLVIVKLELIQMQKRANDMFGTTSAAATEIEIAQRKAFKMVLTMVTTYLLAWCPYAIVSLWITISISKLPDELVMSSAITAKASTCFNPIIYAIMYGNFRKALKDLFHFKSANVGPQPGAAVICEDDLIRSSP